MVLLPYAVVCHLLYINEKKLSLTSDSGSSVENKSAEKQPHNLNLNKR